MAHNDETGVPEFLIPFHVDRAWYERYWWHDSAPRKPGIFAFFRRWTQGITFHTNTKNTPSGQSEEGYRHMKKTFSDKVRDIVRKIPKSKTMTYKEVASKAGNPKAARAVGAVMRSNYDPSIPCHRVVASDGKMRGNNRGARIR
jgi:O-6-methylguanine DNA methyltransferase